MRKDPRLPIWTFLVLFTVLTLIFALCSCSIVGEWEGFEPASVANYEVGFVFRGDYTNLNDFLKRVKSDMLFFKKQGYTIIKIKYELGQDITQKTVVYYAEIYYKEKK